MTDNWAKTPIDMSDLDLSGDGLATNWPLLHAGNNEPYPEDPQVQEAWRRYHLGDFAGAVTLGREIGGEGIVPAAFAATIYAQYVEQDEGRKSALFQQVIKWCEEAEATGLSTANLHYMHAVSMGRYSQFISMIEALAQGFGGRIKEQAQKCLELDNDHAEGHVTLAGWHAAISDQAGALMAKMLYGAERDGAFEHYDIAVALAPDSPVPLIEYADGIEVMFGDSKKADIIAKLEQAMEKRAVDAMQRLDKEKARQHLLALSA
ncbi:hypothetical protein [Pseudohalioglobus lutimaris]|uniref:Uncharacterized protein n=1 Tax=Pseudohalioglobus lutimaris TaxID=1737061 RepID=A0A2N5X5U8_9GAMM|nr:hypothetical protein [Pseudohalioglobus lutimaris]PLW69851.1 hypothetical protein C0039_04780 [Pseudohalioglobus lutimaris]